MAGHIKGYSSGQGSVKDDSGNAVGIKPGVFCVMAPNPVDYIDHHGHQYNSHTHCYGNYKYCIQITNKGQLCHSCFWMEPQRFQNGFKSEYAAEQESENRGKEAAAGNNGCQIHFLCPVQKEAANHQAESLSHISEHKSKKEGIGQSQNDCRVNFIIGGKTVHTDKHFKGPEKLWILQLGRRFADNVFVLFLYKTEGIVILGDLFLEGLCIRLAHPSAENVEGVVILFGAGGQLSYIKVGGIGSELFVGSSQPIFLIINDSGDLLIHRADVCADIGKTAFQSVSSDLGSALVFIRKEETLKMHGCINGVDFITQGMGNKINVPDVIGILHTGMNDGIYGIVNIGHEFVVIIPGHSAEAEFYILKVKNIF